MTRPKPTKRPKGKKTSRQIKEARALKAFNSYILARDDYTCVLTGKRDKQAVHVGHVLTRAKESVKFDEINAYALADWVNVEQERNAEIQRWFERFVVNKHGPQAWLDLCQRGNQPAHFKEYDFKDIEARFKAKLKELEE